MYRIFFKLGPLTVYSYGVMLALAFLAGTYLAERRARKQGFPKDTIVDLSLWMLISSIAGARLLFVIINWEQYRHNILAGFNFGLDAEETAMAAQIVDEMSQIFTEEETLRYLSVGESGHFIRATWLVEGSGREVAGLVGQGYDRQ